MDRDIIVFGAGFAGLTTALRGAELGLRVMVIERGEGHEYLCNSRYSGGLFAVGAASGGLEGGTNAGYIGGLIKSFITGLRASEFIAAGKGPK